MKWKVIDKYPNYKISDTGLCLNIKTNKILKPHDVGSGYLVYRLYFGESKPKIMKAHRLVAQAFIPNPNNYKCVNHKDQNKSNNCVSNLEWCTHKYNTNYGDCVKRRTKTNIDNHNWTIIMDCKIEFTTSADCARMLNVHPSNIYKCLSNVQKTCKGHTFTRKEE